MVHTLKFVQMQIISFLITSFANVGVLNNTVLKWLVSHVCLNLIENLLLSNGAFL